MKEQDVARFEKEILPLIQQQDTKAVVKDLIGHARSLISYLNLPTKLEPADPIPPKPRPDFEKCKMVKNQISLLAKECPESEFNFPAIMGRISGFLVRTEELEKQGIEASKKRA